MIEHTCGGEWEFEDDCPACLESLRLANEAARKAREEAKKEFKADVQDFLYQNYHNYLRGYLDAGGKGFPRLEIKVSHKVFENYETSLSGLMRFTEIDSTGYYTSLKFKDAKVIVNPNPNHDYDIRIRRVLQDVDETDDVSGV